MKKFAIQFVLLVILIFGGLAFYMGKISNVPFLPEPTSTREVIINDQRIKVEIADTPSKRSKGLGERENLATDSGMLFIFPKDDKYSFWMKGLRFPLDLIWIKDNKVVDIIKNAKPPSLGQSDDSLPLFLPVTEVDMVLEVNAGVVDKLGVKVGDTVQVL